MNPKSCLATSLALGVLLLPVAASAQRPQRAPQTTTLAAGIQRGWSGVKRNLTEAAANMPEEHYLLEPNPNQRKDQELLNKSKAEFVAALAASFAYCDPIYLALTDQSAVELVKQGNNMVARGYLLANNVAHSREMYGTSAVYMRLANMVPPSTERRTRSRPR